MFRTLLAALIACLCWAGDASDAKPDAKLPAAAQAALDRYAKSEAKLQADLRKALQGERQKAVAELEKAQKAATKAGDLDAALAVKAQIEELQKADAADADALLGDKAQPRFDALKLAPGRWTIAKSAGPNSGGGAAMCEIHEGGSLIAHLGQLMVPGRWRVEKGRLVIAWMGDETRWENLGFDTPDRMIGDSFDAGKNGIQLIRMHQPPPEAPAEHRHQ